MESHKEVIKRLQVSFRSGVTVPLSFRLTQLKALLSLLEDNETQFLETLHKDLAKPKFEGVLSEIHMVVNELHYAINNLQEWMQPSYADKNLPTKLDDCFVRKEPLGVVLIIGAWNYPLQLIFAPLIGAIAAGNCAIVKPSEISQATERLLSDLIPKYLPQECFAVIRGGADDTKLLLQNKFDHIFFTGSKAVARCILQAAAVHLTPVTLELGGKCPCVLYGHMDMKAAAKRLVWAKFFNAGQSCVAPDYVLCTKEMRDILVPAITEALEDFYGPHVQQSPDYGRIVTDRHWNRLTELLGKSKGKVVIGGDCSREEKFIAPTVVVDLQESDALMEEEIFGPILPIITVESLEQSISFINQREKPLALYVFSNESQVVNTVLEKTSSGGFCSNDGIVQMTLPGLPFGGVGESGMGCYHGRWGFENFSHKRACMLRGWGLERLGAFRYPPYSESNLSWLRWATTTKKSWGLCNIV